MELQAGLQMPPFHAALERNRSAAPPRLTAASGNPSAAAPGLRAAPGDGVCGAPAVLQEWGGGGEGERSAAREPPSVTGAAAEPGSLCGTPSPAAPSPSCAAPRITRRGSRRGAGVPAAPLRERRGGAGRGRRPLPLPAPRTFCFSSQGQRTMRSEETQALTRRRAARWQATGALRTGRCSPPRPARGEGRPRARPARQRRGQSSGARRHCPPPVGSPARQPGSLPSVAPEPSECRARLGPRDRRPGALAGPPRSARRGKRPGARLQLRLLPRPSCAVCEGESLPSPLNSFLPSPPHNMAAAHYSLRRGRGGASPLPPTYGARRPPPLSAPPPAARALRAAPHWPRRALPARPERAHHFHWPRRALLRPPRPRPARTAAAASHWPRSPPLPCLSTRRRVRAIGAGRSPLAPARLLAPRPARRGLAPRPHEPPLSGRRAAGSSVGAPAPPRARALLPPIPAPPRLIPAPTPLRPSTALPSSPGFRNHFIPRQPARTDGAVQPLELPLSEPLA